MASRTMGRVRTKSTKMYAGEPCVEAAPWALDRLRYRIRSPGLTPCDVATSGLMTTLTGLPPLSGSVKANVQLEPWGCWPDPCCGRPPCPCSWVATPCMQFSVATFLMVPVSKVTPGAVE